MIGTGVQQDKDWCLSITPQQPLPNRHNINLFAFPCESCFFTICKDKQAITPSRKRSFQNAGNLPLASAFIGHIPCHLHQPHYTIPSLKHKILPTYTSVLIAISIKVDSPQRRTSGMVIIFLRSTGNSTLRSITSNGISLYLMAISDLITSFLIPFFCFRTKNRFIILKKVTIYFSWYTYQIRIR